MASCIASCSDHIDCDSAGYDETTGTCYEYSSQVQGSGTYNPNIQFAKITKRAVVVDGVTYTYPVTTSYITALPSSSSASFEATSSPGIISESSMPPSAGLSSEDLQSSSSLPTTCLFGLDSVLNKLTSEQLIIGELSACLNNDKYDQQHQHQQHQHQQHLIFISFFELHIRAERKPFAVSRTKFNHRDYQRQFDFHLQPKFDLGLLVLKDYHYN
ncbi:hypothetical protein KC343_g11784 [Hortaea werneckii]|nr:hypothetical protein KC352_g21661 [Hortaea werneckii]KAI7556965.1 hypothetical protein KC317_g11918 [Hortaea werneckii]KAI7603977.1 hypothetical protein KC346_g11655 [Hortaea werneckii]KAI7610838.1 hypothetical protein KC343_g11784 [Hortaea werneckii]KAI7648027.1 hypothetical protein KC319_g11512 [Hortaea werneckii]